MTRFFVCSDFHENLNKVLNGKGISKNVQGWARKFDSDAILYLGENLHGLWGVTSNPEKIRNFFQKEEKELLSNWVKATEIFYEQLSGSGKGLPVYGVPGAHDGLIDNNPNYGLELMEESDIICLHERKDEIKGWEIGGFGGHKPIGSPFEFTESEIYKGVKGLGKVDILITHTVPWGKADISSQVGYPGESKKDYVRNNQGELRVHAGSKGLRKAIEEIQPFYNVGDHIHEEARTVDILRKTKIYNVSGVVGVLDTLEDHMDFYKIESLGVL